eukprot:Selendium_serpulae@DN6350_c0_g2_i2.p1
MSSDYRKTVTIVAAVGKDGLIGQNGDLPWHIPEDLRRFSSLTKGPDPHPGTTNSCVIMGRKTWESFPPKMRPLRDRFNAIVSKSWATDGVSAPSEPQCKVFGSIGDALHEGMKFANVFVIGGSSLYDAFLPIPAPSSAEIGKTVGLDNDKSQSDDKNQSDEKSQSNSGQTYSQLLRTVRANVFGKKENDEIVLAGLQFRLKFKSEQHESKGWLYHFVTLDNVTDDKADMTTGCGIGPWCVKAIDVTIVDKIENSSSSTNV